MRKFPVTMVHVKSGAEVTVDTPLEMNNLAVNGYAVQTEKKKSSTASKANSASKSASETDVSPAEVLSEASTSTSDPAPKSK